MDSQLLRRSVTGHDMQDTVLETRISTSHVYVMFRHVLMQMYHANENLTYLF